MSSVAERLKKEVVAAPAKAAVLAILTAVFLYVSVPFVISLLSRSETGTPRTVGAPAPATATDRSELGDPNRTAIDAVDAGNSTVATSGDWSSLAPVGELPRDPFDFDYDQLSPPVLFADDSQFVRTAENDPTPNNKEEVAIPEVAVAEPPRPARDPASYGLELKSTIVGPSRSVALINSRIYREGARIEADGATLLVKQVRPKRVLIDDGVQTFELTIDRWNSTASSSGNAPN
ncbi:hypothetical protein [Stratiformator vulcanicus]|uniref:Type II secretion system protein GspC N-terminal domain-containing protein n=1 Tax=Stratiformator vulcanicus TaxID=2527980 RepID=A0A517R512_9PLAN|nr:hypothetical protein [Stratiformator vulcanicus]QDT38978.1 hypothetical protein Pan189_33780 [Stratiformator vulcanicus]